MLRYLGLKLLAEKHEGIREESSCIIMLSIEMLKEGEEASASLL